MKRNNGNPKHLATGKRSVCGYKAKAAIFAGMVALAMVPVTAYAATMPADAQGEPQQMEQAFEPECVILFPNGLEIRFNRGTLPSQRNGYALVLDYDERLSEILHPWAVPVDYAD